MIRFLVERGVPVNARSRYGHTPLINAASKGAIAVVEYLLNETDADPLLRNDFGETAYDAAAAVGSVYLCELLEAAERSCWMGDHPYSSLSMHVTVPVLIYENQRANNSLIRVGLGKPTFSSTALGKNDRRTAWSMYPSGEPTTKSHVRLPALDASWFWMTDWSIDYSSPDTDREGWQYAKSFQDEVWTGSMPTSGTGWVRRRRWMRIMKRRIDQDREVLEQIAEEEEEEQQDVAQQSSTTVGMSLTKAQSVFVGCTTHVQTIEEASRQSSLEWTRSARSSISSNRPYVWEPNEQAPECRRCGRWFNLLVRRHHCRRCGLVVCDKCSNRGVMLPFSHIVQDPAIPLEQHYLISLEPQRVCDACFNVLSRPSSIMMECPVCGKGLDEFGSAQQQERHVQTCLNANTPTALTGIRYVARTPFGTGRARVCHLSRGIRARYGVLFFWVFLCAYGP
ncbi:FYVE zinc finger-domain-containing protein [Fennellomyces sp. T-0311]|nr:FYVE zinc finger-domain-containing protein [Fennellomyces sp. T-0311]